MVRKIGLIILFTAQLIWAEPRLVLTEGVLFIKGSLSLDYAMSDFTALKQSLGLHSSLGAGFFLADNLAVGVSVPFDFAFIPTGFYRFGLSFFSSYYFATDSIVFPCLGLSITPFYNVGKKSMFLSSGVNASFLVSVSEMVALDIGIAPQIDIPLNSGQHWAFKLPAGFLGIRAFF